MFTNSPTEAVTTVRGEGGVSPRSKAAGFGAGSVPGARARADGFPAGLRRGRLALDLCAEFSLQVQCELCWEIIGKIRAVFALWNEAVASYFCWKGLTS